jgi:inner membrane transporter RhtA
VTLEFLGPLSVALAGSRRRVDLVCALFAGAAVVVLARPEPTTDYLGIALGYAAAAGILASAVPFVADPFTLRRVPARFFGVFMSVNPVLAALIGLAVLDQSLRWVEWLAIAAIVTANTVSVLTAGHRAPGPSAAARRPRQDAW